MNLILNILACLVLGFITSSIIIAIISLHIETYCEKIGVNISKLDDKSLLGLPISHNQNRKILEKYTSKLLVKYTIISAVVILFIIYI